MGRRFTKTEDEQRQSSLELHLVTREKQVPYLWFVHKTTIETEGIWSVAFTYSPETRRRWPGGYDQNRDVTCLQPRKSKSKDANTSSTHMMDRMKHNLASGWKILRKSPSRGNQMSHGSRHSRSWNGVLKGQAGMRATSKFMNETWEGKIRQRGDLELRRRSIDSTKQQFAVWFCCDLGGFYRPAFGCQSYYWCSTRLLIHIWSCRYSTGLMFISQSIRIQLFNVLLVPESAFLIYSPVGTRLDVSLFHSFLYECASPSTSRIGE